MPTEAEFIAEKKAAKEQASRPIPVEAGVAAVASAVGTKLGRGVLRSISQSDRHHPSVRAMARTAQDYPTSHPCLLTASSIGRRRPALRVPCSRPNVSGFGRYSPPTPTN